MNRKSTAVRSELSPPPLVLSLLAWVLAMGPASAALPGLPPYQGTPLEDRPYLQEIGRQVPNAEPVLAVAVWEGQVAVGTRQGLAWLKDERLEPDAAMRTPVRRLVVAEGSLWAIAERGLHRRTAEGWKAISTEPVVDVCAYRGSMIAATARRLWRVVDDRLEAWGEAESRFNLERVVVQADSVMVAGEGRLTAYAQGRFGAKDVYDSHTDRSWDWGSLPSKEVRDVIGMGPRLILGTARGLGVLRGMTLTAVGGAEGLPVEDVLCLAPGFDGDLWIGTSRGAIRNLNGAFHYFAGRRWLPSDAVRSIAVSGRSVYVGTDLGLGILDYEPYTLARKAAYYERHLEEWGQKRLGLVQKLEWDEASKQFVREAGDNDGGYTGDYLAAQAYRYAVTRDPEARREATNTFHTLRWMEAMTGIRGFPARSIWVTGERGHKSTGGSGGYPAEWHPVAGGTFEWKGDTSSDELCSHFYAFALFLELAAEGDEKRQAVEHLSRMARHLVENRWQLLDVDGRPTRWGRWDPEYFLTDEGHYDRGLQCLELLSFIKTAETLTGDALFTGAYRQLVELGYPEHTLRQRNTFPPEAVLHFLDQLAFWSYWNLLRYETDPDRRSLYRRSFERSFEVVRCERQPWFDFVYGALTGVRVDPEHALEHLREWPLDLRIWSYRNSHRLDLGLPSDCSPIKGTTRALSPRETEPLRWDHWTMQLDGGAGGQDVVEPSGWLLAYWMGRYHGFIAAPRVEDPRLLTVEHSLNRHLGAAPYTGPGRPAVP